MFTFISRRIKSEEEKMNLARLDVSLLYYPTRILSLLSDIGRMLGASVLSVVEIFYFFVIRLMNNLWWKNPLNASRVVI